MTPDLIILAVLATLAMLLIISIVKVANKNAREVELRRSNARVLKEYKSIVVHRPEYIVNYSNRRSNTHGDRSTRINDLAEAPSVD